MKRLLVLLPFLLGTAASGADLDHPRYSERDIYIEEHPRVVEYRYQRVPSALYDDFFTPPYRSHVWRWRPGYYAYGRPRRFHRHWRHHHRHRR
jgi:hypothetical protein